jgi:hypothetical protein
MEPFVPWLITVSRHDGKALGKISELKMEKANGIDYTPLSLQEREKSISTSGTLKVFHSDIKFLRST